MVVSFSFLFTDGKVLSPSDVPGLEKAESIPLADKNVVRKVKSILESIKKERKTFWPFLEPVNPKEVPLYYDYIRFPIDVKTMNERLKTGYYKHVSFSFRQ